MLVIAGVSGHVGSVAAGELLAKGKKIKVLVRDAKKGEAWSKRGAEVAVGQLGDEAFLTTALKGATGFFTLLPMDFGATDILAYQKKLGTTIANAVKASGVPHVVLLSSIGADLAEGTGPIKGLHHFESFLRATGTKLTSIRAGYFQENLGMSIAPARDAGIFPNFTPSADYPMPMIATKDIGHLVAESFLSPPAKSENVDLVGPSYSMRQIAEKLGQRLGKTLNVVDIPAAGHLQAFTQAGLPPALAASYTEMNAGFASGNIRPVGDRLVQGKTTIDDVIAAMLPA